jgi:hypothetical protein
MPEETIATASRVLEQMKVYNAENNALPVVHEAPKLASSG